jgi:hypothetical protein
MTLMMRVKGLVKDLIGSTRSILTVVIMKKGKKKVPSGRQRSGLQSLVILVVMNLKAALRRRGRERRSKGRR